MQKRLIVRIAPDGQIHAHVEGIKGKKCMDFIPMLEEMLEAETYDSNYTQEYYEEETVPENRVSRQIKE